MVLKICFKRESKISLFSPFNLESMSETIDITGRWLFSEDFGYGTDTGYADLEQMGSRISGTLQFAEQIEGEETFIVRQEIYGTLTGRIVSLKSKSCEILFNNQDIIYEMDSWKGRINNEGKITGDSIDDEGTTGKFVMERVNVQASGSSDDISFGIN